MGCENLSILDSVCENLGITADDNMQRAYQRCLAEFQKRWKEDPATGTWSKVCRVFLIPQEIDHRGYDHHSAGYWGRESNHGAYFAYDSEDSRYLTPLSLVPHVWNGEDSAVEVTTGNGNELFFRAVAKKLGCEPEFLDFEELIVNGIELELVISRDDYERAIKKSNGESKTWDTVAEILYGQGSWIGKFVSDPEVKALIPILAWTVWGLKVPVGKVEEMKAAITNAICPPIVAKDMARARFIQRRTEEIFGCNGKKFRGKSYEQKASIVKEWDDMLTSIGVAVPYRATKMPSAYIKEEGER